MKDGQFSCETHRDLSGTFDTSETTAAVVIVNADDWGRDVLTTDRSLDCILEGAVSSVSTMVFMADSERAADLAKQHGVDAGLHINFTLGYSGSKCPIGIMERQAKVARFLQSHKLARFVYHPGLVNSFEYIVKKQLEEYERLYGVAANRIDGHHHMHLCANVMRQKLIPRHTVVRRNLSFRPEEKGYLNRFYRFRQDRLLARRNRLTDFFFDLQPLEPQERLSELVKLGIYFDVEIETHPVREEEYRFLIAGGLKRVSEKVGIARGYILRFGNSGPRVEDVSWPQKAWR